MDEVIKRAMEIAGITNQKQEQNNRLSDEDFNLLLTMLSNKN